MYFCSQPIVRNGLVLQVDGANVKSYIGTGTTVNDLSGNNNTGTLTGSVTFDSTTKSFVFPNNNTVENIGFGDPTSLKISGSITLEAWVYPTQLTGGAGVRSIITKWHLNSFKLSLWNSALVLDLSGTGGGDNYVQATSTLSLNTWYHVVGVYNTVARTMTLYVNGVVVTTGAVSGAVPTSLYTGTSTTVKIGADGDSNNFFGKIPIARIYNRDLSATEVAQNFNATKGRFGL